MTHRRSWQKAETRICRTLGGERTPLSGENSRHTSADCIGVPEYVEVKMMVDPTAHEHLAEVHEIARRYERGPRILYQALDENGFTETMWWAIWLDDYVTGDGERAALGPRMDDAAHSGWVLDHRIGKRLPHRTLVEDTVQAAREEDKPPLVVLQKKGSPRRVALVPLTEDHA